VPMQVHKKPTMGCVQHSITRGTSSLVDAHMFYTHTHNCALANTSKHTRAQKHTHVQGQAATRDSICKKAV
jgi:hypothetical protein